MPNLKPKHPTVKKEEARCFVFLNRTPWVRTISLLPHTRHLAIPRCLLETQNPRPCPSYTGSKKIPLQFAQWSLKMGWGSYKQGLWAKRKDQGRWPLKSCQILAFDYCIQPLFILLRNSKVVCLFVLAMCWDLFAIFLHSIFCYDESKWSWWGDETSAHQLGRASVVLLNSNIQDGVLLAWSLPSWKHSHHTEKSKNYQSGFGDRSGSWLFFINNTCVVIYQHIIGWIQAPLKFPSTCEEQVSRPKPVLLLNTCYLITAQSRAKHQCIDIPSM